MIARTGERLPEVADRPFGRGAAHSAPPASTAAGSQAPRRKRNFWSIAIFVLLVSGVGIRAYQDLSQPDAWDYWKDQYISPSMTFSVIANADLDGAGQGPPRPLRQRDDRPRRGELRFATGSTRPVLPPAT